MCLFCPFFVKKDYEAMSIVNPMRKIHTTKQGYVKLEKEYNDLLAQRPDAVENLTRARELGDLRENGYYKASRAKLSFIDSRLLYLKSVLKNAQIVEVASTDVVTIGCTVRVKNGVGEKVFTIVGELEADPLDGKLSEVSPIGKALLGKQIGESVTIQVPAGNIHYTILHISA